MGHNILKFLVECERYGIYERLYVPYLIRKNARMYTSWKNCRCDPIKIVARRSIEAALRECEKWLNSGDTK